MKIKGRANEPVSLTMETMKELLSISTALSICLHHWHKGIAGDGVDSHFEIIEEALILLRGVR